MTSFDNSIRALEADKSRPFLIITVFSAILLVGWGIWFFGARITLFERSDIVTINSSGEVEAQFPNDTIQHIRVGQSAWLRLDGEIGEATGMIPLVVTRAQREPQQESGRVLLLVTDETFYSILLQSGLTGQVEIESERLSPARLILRSTGQFGGAPQISTTGSQ